MPPKTARPRLLDTSLSFQMATCYEARQIPPLYGTVRLEIFED